MTDLTALSILYALLFYAAIAVLIGGITNKVLQYSRVPAPLKIPVTPAPLTKGGVAWRLTTEVVFFNSLFRSSKWTWIFGWIFHVSLLLAFFRHLRYVISPDSFLWPIVSLEVVQSFGKYAGFAMVVGLLGLLGRRIFVDRVRYISSPSDYLMLLLIIGIAASGLMMTYVAHTDIVQLKALTMVLILSFVFPISKLLHAPGLFFSPTRNQVDNPREQRHLSPWAAEMEARDGRNA